MPRREGFRARALSMTPLIDIIFLLLLFFMLTSTFTRFAEVPLVQAAGGETPDAAETRRLFLRLSGNGLALNGRPLTGPLPEAVAADLAGEEALGLLAVTSGVASQTFVEVLEALRDVPGLSVAVLQ